jgi:hypothetical protein
MMVEMSEPPVSGETWESYFGERRRSSVFRPFKRQLALERKHLEQRLNGLYRAVCDEMGSVEGRIAAKLEEIDASLNLIARELARRDSEPPTDGTGS